MMIGRLRQPEQRLEEPVDTGRPEQILPAHHVGDALQSVVENGGEVIAGRRFLARKHDVAPQLRRGGDDAGLAARPGAGLGPGQAPARATARIHGQPERESSPASRAQALGADSLRARPG